jgi:hypothetical protein
MTPEDVRIKVQVKTGYDSLSEATVLEWCKDAVVDIIKEHPMAGVYTEVALKKIAGRQQLPTRVREVVSVQTWNGAKLWMHQDWDIDNGNWIVLHNAVGAIITYYAYPKVDELGMNAELPLPFEFQDAVKSYVAAMFAARLLGEDAPATVSYKQEFNQKVLDAAELMAKTRTRSQVIPIPRRGYKRNAYRR